MDRKDDAAAFLQFLRRYQSEDIYEDFDLDAVPVDNQGFQVPDNAKFFDDVFEALRPVSLLELGTWKGTSAIMFAKKMRSYGEKPYVACVDTWIGSREHWNNPKWFPQLGLKHGFPTLYQRFLANVIRAGCKDIIVPLPMTTKTALGLARTAGIKVDCIYVDASHEFDDVLADLNGVWGLIGDDGIVIADDYNAPDVRRAVQTFCKNTGAYGLFNANSGWPQSVLAKTKSMRARMIEAHPALTDVPPLAIS